MTGKIKTKVELKAKMAEGGWSLVCGKLNSGWYIQKGKPGHGGDSINVYAAAANGIIKDGKVRCIGTIWNSYYVWGDK